MRNALLTLAGALALAGCRGGESDQPPVHLIHNMDTQEKGRPYRADSTGLFADGRMMRPPVEGTVALGQLDEDEVLYEGLDADGGVTFSYPASILVDGKVDDATRERGRQRYQIYCLPCHGVGDGKGVMTQPALDGGVRLQVKPPSYYEQRLKDLPVGKIYSAIRNGVNLGNMPSYATQIPVEDRWAIVTYVRKLQLEQDPSLKEEGGVSLTVAKAAVSSLEHGALLYKAKACEACHSLDGTRKVGPSFKGVYGKLEKTSAGEVTVDDAYIKESVLTPMAKIVEGYPPAMPPQTLDEVEIGSLILFIKAQK